MAAEQQLERSVLERKEREELRAIAQAMSLDTNSRSKKADIIDQILRAAGVEVSAGSANGGPGAPAKTRGPGRGAASNGESEDLDLDADANNGAGHGLESANGTSRSSTSASLSSSSSGSSGSSGGTQVDVSPSPDEADESSGDSGQFDGEQPAAGREGGPTPSERSTAGARQGGGQNQNRQHVQQGGGANEPGNRRGRRRRGRERGAPGGSGERELQGGGQEAQYSGELIPVRGLLDLRDEGYGFLRAEGYLPSSKDVYISISQARRFALRRGDFVEGACRPAASNEKFPALIRIDSVCGLAPDEARGRPRFEDLTPLFPDEKLRLETTGAAEVTTRIIDLLSPIGKGQRGMIVSPPKAGKTTILKQIAHSIEANNPEVHLIVLLVDERPEEVTDMRRSVKGEVVASTFDRPSDEHTAIAELTIDRAKRLVELGRDVVIVLDGITRLARAYNLAQPASGRIMSGGVDSGALYPPKRFFGAARNIEEGGSLTILATALVETGSKMDEVIFEEFKGTGNMELRLDRRLAERRLYPSIDVNASSTRHEELLFERGQLQQVWKLRRVLNALAADGSAAAGLELLMDKIRSTKSNDEFLAEIAKGPAPPV
jgi:transcription termination factor Rho